MEDNIYRCFMLDNSLAAVSAFTHDGEIFATDGHECTVHCMGDNCCNKRISTTRPYRRLRRGGTGRMTALGCCQSRRLYFISDCFEEMGYVTLDTSRTACRSDLGELVDASLTTVGAEEFIVGAFEKSAYLFDMGGSRLTRLCSAESGEIITDFISLGNDIFAMSTLKNGLRTVTVTDNGREYSGIVGKGQTLRMLFSVGNDIYGLFGRSYIYNRIARIYSNGAFTLPDRNVFCD